MTQATDRQAPIAALPFKALFDIDALLTKVAETLRSEGRSLAGVIQGRSKAARHVDNLVLRDLADGGESRILQDLGSQSQGCRLNPQALAIISENLMRQLERRPDLLIVNRFGRGEAEGHGLRPVIEKAVTLEVPVLVAVRDEYRPAWEAFSQGVAIGRRAGSGSGLGPRQPFRNRRGRERGGAASGKSRRRAFDQLGGGRTRLGSQASVAGRASRCRSIRSRRQPTASAR